MLRRDPGLYLYLLGDLDDFFWPHTTWYGWQADQLEAIALVYSGDELPVLLAFGEGPAAALLLDSLKPLLPRRFYAHLSPGLEAVISEDWHLSGGEDHYRMVLTQPEQLVGCPEAVILGAEDLPALGRLYAEAYPGNWFNARMLATGQYLGLRQEQELLAVAGVHVYAPARGVAALGNIAIHPDVRGQGLARRLTGELCLRLRSQLDLIGLNVHTQNTPALRCYRRLGFEISASYREWIAEPIRPFRNPA